MLILLTNRFKALCLSLKVTKDSNLWLSGAKMEEEETDAAPDANDALVQKVHEVFPDICPIYLDRVTAVYGYNANSIISFIMDQEEAGRPYQREPQKKPRKRKRDAERELEAEVTRIKRKYTNPERLLQPPSQERFYKL